VRIIRCDGSAYWHVREASLLLRDGVAQVSGVDRGLVHPVALAHLQRAAGFRFESIG